MSPRDEEVERGCLRFDPPRGLVLEQDLSLASGELVFSFPLPVERGDLPRLTTAERAVLREVARGLSNAQIALQRRVSTRTVANQLSHVFEKLGVHSRLDALRVAGHRLGMTANGERKPDASAPPMR